MGAERGALALALCVSSLTACGDDGPTSARRTRSLTDLPDDHDAPVVHVLYAVPSDGVDRERDVTMALDHSVAAWNAWFAARADGQAFRLDTHDGVLDVTFVRLRPTTERFASRGIYIRDALEVELEELGAIQPGKLYAVYYEGRSTHACADGPLPPALIGQVAALYLHGEPPGATPCDRNPMAERGDDAGYLELAMLHELMHAAGAVGSCAPHAGRAGHVTDDPRDLMYAGDAPWRPALLDLDHDDYFGHGRSDCPDLARSAFLDPPHASAELPPGW